MISHLLPMRAEDVQKTLSAQSRPDIAVALRRFFQTGPGGYGEGDRFRGIKVPAIRKTALAFAALPFPEASGCSHRRGMRTGSPPW